MSICDINIPGAVVYQCPICGKALPSEPVPPRFDAPCSDCRYHLWCRRRASDGEVVLEVLPQRTPQPDEVEQLVDALVREHESGRVMVDLSRLESIDSCLAARLVAMNKSLRSSGGQLVLRGLGPTVREIIRCFRLNHIFEIAN